MRYFIDSPSSSTIHNIKDQRFAIELIVFLYSMIPFMDLPAISDIAWPNNYWKNNESSPQAARIIFEKFLHVCLFLVLLSILY
jgi:hypothetical protein